MLRFADVAAGGSHAGREKAARWRQQHGAPAAAQAQALRQ